MSRSLLRDDEALPRGAELDVGPQRVQLRDDARFVLIDGEPVHRFSRVLCRLRGFHAALLGDGHEIEVRDGRDDEAARVGVAGLLRFERFRAGASRR